MIPQKRSWIRQEKRFRVEAVGYIQPVTLSILDDMTFVMVTDYPVYDNGAYFVIDVVLDLQWCVRSRGGIKMKTFIDKYEAIRYADDLLIADLRKERDERDQD